MSTFEWLLVGIVVALIVGSVAAWLIWRHLGVDAKAVMSRIAALPIRAKLRLIGALLTEERVPPLMRLLVTALVLYLVLPVDLIPDFIPVLGQVDDIVVGAASVVLLFRFLPRPLLEELILRQELGEG